MTCQEHSGVMTSIRNIESSMYRIENKVDSAIKSKVSWRSLLIFITIFISILGVIYTAQTLLSRDISEIKTTQNELIQLRKNNEILEQLSKQLVEVLREKSKNN